MYQVRLDAIGERKISVIKVVREATGLGLADTKRLVESAPCLIAERSEHEAASSLMNALRAEGAQASLSGGGSSESSTFQVYLEEPGLYITQIIDLIYLHFGIERAEAWSRIERLPAALGALSKEDMGGVIEDFEDAGATLMVKPSASPGVERWAEGQLRVWLEDIKGEKIAAIKVVRSFFQLGLREAKELVERAPVELGHLAPREAERLVGAFSDYGIEARLTSGSMPVERIGVGTQDPEAEVKLHLEDTGSRKIQVIKTLRAHLMCGLKEAKEIADAAPIEISMTVESAQELRASLLEAGALVRVARG